MKREAGTVTAPGIRCSGTTRSDVPCRGYARYSCTCGRHWCGTHVVRSGADLRCPACGRRATIA